MTYAVDQSTIQKPGPRLSLSIGVIILGTIVGIVGLALGISKVVHDFNGTVYTAPNAITRQFNTGTYEVFVEVLDPTLPDVGGDVSASDVSVSGPGSVVPFDRLSGTSETIGNGNGTYDGVVEFKITQPGNYTVTLNHHNGENYFVTNSFADLAKHAAGWFVMTGVGFLIGVAGVVMLIVGIVRRRRFSRGGMMPAYAGGYPGGFPGGVPQPYQPTQPIPPAPQAATPAPGWYADPSIPGTERWWDGARWTDQTQQSSS